MPTILKENESANALAGVTSTKFEEKDAPRSDSDSGLPEMGTPAERVRAERRLVRKLHCRLLPTIFLIYIMNYIDVCSNVPSASALTGHYGPEKRDHYGSFEGL